MLETDPRNRTEVQENPEGGRKISGEGWVVLSSQFSVVGWRREAKTLVPHLSIAGQKTCRNAFTRSLSLQADTRSFDCVRRTPHFAQDDSVGVWGPQLLVMSRGQLRSFAPMGRRERLHPIAPKAGALGPTASAPTGSWQHQSRTRRTR